jgi:hypothetical protein
MVPCAKAAFGLLTLAAEPSEPVLQEIAVLGRGRGQVDHRIDLRREFLLARPQSTHLRPLVNYASRDSLKL